MLSLIAMAGSLAIIYTKGFNYGVDFKGGAMIEVRAKYGTADIAAIRDPAWQPWPWRCADPKFRQAG